MDIALALLILWGLLFVPIGLVVHQVVLGEGARLRALPLAPLTGIAVAFLVLAGLGRVGIDGGDRWVPWAFVGASLASILYVWRASIPWRSRELIGSTALLLLAVVLLQPSVFGGAQTGPLGYGTAVNPVEEVAAIDADAHGRAAKLDVAREAHAAAEGRPIAFEEFVAMTVAAGRPSGEQSTSGTTRWSAYALHAPISGLFAILTLLPLFGFARARGMRTFGLILLVPLGVLAPAVFLAVANGAGSAISTIPFTAAGVFALLVARRDRGWWALTVLFGAAIAVAGGILALLPFLVIGIAWMLVRSTTYEHLSQHDAPVGRSRALTVAAVAAGLGALGVASTIGGSGELLAWQGLHHSLFDAVRSWPFSWLDPDLGVGGPADGLETVVWLIGPVLLVVAFIFAIARNERRELGVLVGVTAAALVAVVTGLVDSDAGIRLLEYTILVTSPLTAALALRAVALAREGAAERGEQSGIARLSGVGPTLIVCLFAMLSMAATAVTGTRMVHAPELQTVGEFTHGTALVAAGDPWLAFVVDGERVHGGYADADQLSDSNPSLSERSITFGRGYDRLVLSNSPLASDPPGTWYVEGSELDSYQARLFSDARGKFPAAGDPQVDTAMTIQRSKSATDNAHDAVADAAIGNTPEAEHSPGAAGTGPLPGAATVDDTALGDEGTVPLLGSPIRHSPVEGVEASVPADRPAGRLLPATDIDGCGAGQDITVEADIVCNPTDPVLGDGCTKADAKAVAPRAGATPARENQQKLNLIDDRQLPDKPPLLGVQCFDVDVASASDVLLVHLRDIGVILAPEQAKASPGAKWSRVDAPGRLAPRGGSNGGVRRTTSANGATLTYGNDRLTGAFDLTLEGAFGAGVQLESVAAASLPDTPVSTLSLAELRGAANGFGQVLRDVSLIGNVQVADRGGTAIELGRLFARRRDIPPACNVPIPLKAGSVRRVRRESTSLRTNQLIERDGLTVAVSKVRDSGRALTARVVVGSHLADSGLPHYVLVDWTEQYAGDITVQGCDGAMHSEGPTSRVTGTSNSPVSSSQLRNSLGGGDAGQ